MVDTILRAPPYADYATAADADVQTTAVRAEDARRLHPALWLLGEALIHARGPLAAACERRPLPPDLSSSLSASHRSDSDYPGQCGCKRNSCSHAGDLAIGYKGTAPSSSREDGSALDEGHFPGSFIGLAIGENGFRCKTDSTACGKLTSMGRHLMASADHDGDLTIAVPPAVTGSRSTICNRHARRARKHVGSSSRGAPSHL